MEESLDNGKRLSYEPKQRPTENRDTPILFSIPPAEKKMLTHNQQWDGAAQKVDMDCLKRESK